MRTSTIICFLLTAALNVFSQSAPPIEPGVSQGLAQWRAARYSDVRYKLNLTLEKMSPVLKGTMEIHVRVNIAGDDVIPLYEGGVSNVPDGQGPVIVLDWRKIAGHEKDSKISNVTINGASLDVYGNEAYHLDVLVRPYVIADQEHLIFSKGVKLGENVIKLDFTSPILTSGSAITRYVDKEDGSEYLYSLFVPSDASTAFPVFDQPDLKAKFTLNVNVPTKWKVISNSAEEDYHGLHQGPPVQGQPSNQIVRESFYFEETKPISTYVFAFATGPWVSVPPAEAGGSSSITTNSTETASVDTKASAANAQPPATAGGTDKNGAALVTNIYVRKSQEAKFKPHAAETFRLMREGVKYLESYFDYKFPFPKYDLVLIPEFPFGGMEHAGATFVREQSIIFPTEPTRSDYINRAVLIFHETAHQWFGDTVTMKWFDDLWLKEGFANFMAYKALEKIMPEMNAWKVFYERIKQPAYATDSTRGTTAIYQPIANLSAAKSAYGNIVYNKAPAFLRQAEFYLGEQKFQTAVRAFLKKHEYANAGWEDLVMEFEGASGKDLKEWATRWVKTPGLPVIRTVDLKFGGGCFNFRLLQTPNSLKLSEWSMALRPLVRFKSGPSWEEGFLFNKGGYASGVCDAGSSVELLFPNSHDYGYGIFLLDDKSRDYVLKNIGLEKDPFLRSMMWGSLWDSVREAELDPKDYVELAIKNLGVQSASFSLSSSPGKTQAKACTLNCGETDETIVASVLGRVSTAMSYYLSDAQRTAIAPRLEAVLLDRLQHAPTAGQRITFYRAFVGMASTDKGRDVLKQMLQQSVPPAVAGGLTSGAITTGKNSQPQPPATAGGTDKAPSLRTKDKFDIVTRLAILGDPDAPKLLAGLEKSETGDDAKRYAYAAHAAFGTAENKANFWSDFANNKDISESWIESAMVPFNSIRHAELTRQYLAKALAELPNLKRSRKIFFVNGWLGAFIGGQRDQASLDIVNKFLSDNPALDNDLRLKVLENVDLIERAVKIRAKYGK